LLFGGTAHFFKEKRMFLQNSPLCLHAGDNVLLIIWVVVVVVFWVWGLAKGRTKENVFRLL